MLPEDTTNSSLFRDCFSSALLQRVALTQNSSKPRKKRASKGRKASIESKASATVESRSAARDEDGIAEDLAEFTEFLATETFEALPPDLQELSYSQLQADSKLQDKWIERLVSDIVEEIIPTIPASVTESLDTYSLLSSRTSFRTLLNDSLSAYLDSISVPTPLWSSTRTLECEICGRDWMPLTYHHLIPKEAHAKAIKRGWHEEWMLNSVAWLCRACHSFVHRIASNDELAKDFFTVEKLTDREDVQDWAKWVGRVRWKAR